MNSNQRFVVRTAVAAATFATAAAIAYAGGVRVNETESLPPGIWQVYTNDPVPARGTVLNFCPPDTKELGQAKARGYLSSGPCPGGYEPLFKPVAAVEGDEVTVDGTGVYVNGRKLRNSAPITTDGQGNLMPSRIRGRYAVERGTIWVVSSYSAYSFDSRYFGPIGTASVNGAARPIWISKAKGAFHAYD